MTAPNQPPKPAAIFGSLFLLMLGSASVYAFFFIFNKNLSSPGGILTASLAALLPILAILVMQSGKKQN